MSPTLPIPTAPASLLLRQATLADLPQIMVLETAGFEAGIREDEAVFRDRIETFAAGFVVAASPQQPQHLLAYLCSERWSGQAQPGAAEFAVGHSARERHDEQGAVLYISSMTISPALRGQGLGRWLLEASIAMICQACPGIDRHLLIVNEAWLPARRIYETAGYHYIATLPDFFTPEGRERQAALVMDKPARPRHEPQ